MATSKIESNLDSYSLSEKIVGTWIDGSPIYRKCKVYTWAGQRLYDNDFFVGVSLKQVIQIRVTVMSGTTYAQTSYYWTASDFARAWVTLTQSPPQIGLDVAAQNGAQILVTVDYTKQ